MTKWLGLLLLAVIGTAHSDSDVTTSHHAQQHPQQAVVDLASSPASIRPLQQVQAVQLQATTAMEADKSIAASTAEEPAHQATVASYRLTPKLDRESLHQYKAVEVVATGYYAGKESTGKNPGHPEYGITYSGVKVKRDETAFSTIAADPRVFPIGTVLYVPGYGYGVVADTGGAIKGKKIDLYFDTKDQVFREWGKRTVTVFVVKEGEGIMTEVLWNQLEDEILKI